MRVFCKKERIVRELGGMYTWFQKHIRTFWYNDFWSEAILKSIPEEVDPMKKLESDLYGELTSLFLRVTQKSPQEIINNPKYAKIPTTARSTVQRMIDFWELDFNFSLRNLGDKWRLTMIQKVIQNGFQWKDTIIIFSNNGWYAVKSVQEYNNEVLWDITKFNKNVFNSIFSSPQNLIKYQNTISPKNWSDLWLYFESRQWNSKLLDGINPILYKKFFEWLVISRKAEERKKIDPMIAQVRTQFSESKEVQKGMKLLLEKSWIHFDESWNVDIDRVIWEIINKKEKEWLTEADAIKHLQWDLEELSKKTGELARSIKSERSKLLQEIGWEGTTVGKFEELKSITIKTKGVDGKDVDLKNTAIITLTKDQAEQVLATISSSLDKNTISPKIAKLIITLWLQAKYGEMKRAEGSIRKLATEVKSWNINITKKTTWENVVTISEVSRAKILWAAKVTEQSANIEDTANLLKWTLNIKSLEEAQVELRNLRNKWILTQEDKEKEALLMAYINKNIELAYTHKSLSKSIWEQEARILFQEYYEVGRWQTLKNGEKIEFGKWNDITDTMKREEKFDGIPHTITDLPIWKTENIEKFLDIPGAAGSYPELQSIEVTKLQNGQYMIKNITNSPVSEAEVKEYIDIFKHYSDVWLTQLIPHLPFIIDEFRIQWFDVQVDGTNDIKKHEILLGEVFKKLFKKEIPTWNLQIIKDSFRSKLWDPTNMRNAMQRILQESWLITTQDTWIKTDTLRNWFRGNNTEQIIFPD